MMIPADPSKRGDLCKTLLFARFQCQTQISILEIPNVCLGLKSSPSPGSRSGIFDLNLNKDEHFSKVSLGLRFTPTQKNLYLHCVPTPKTGVFALFQ